MIGLNVRDESPGEGLILGERIRGGGTLKSLIVFVLTFDVGWGILCVVNNDCFWSVTP